MSQEWKPLKEGIKIRYHATRKHGIRPDAYFTLRIQINGKRTEESLGWDSHYSPDALHSKNLQEVKKNFSGTGFDPGLGIFPSETSEKFMSLKL